jgi:hypothetical protein
LAIESFKVQSKLGKGEFERIESTERKLKALFARVDSLERLSSRERSGYGDPEQEVYML